MHLLRKMGEESIVQLEIQEITSELFADTQKKWKNAFPKAGDRVRAEMDRLTGVASDLYAESREKLTPQEVVDKLNGIVEKVDWAKIIESP